MSQTYMTMEQYPKGQAYYKLIKHALRYHHGIIAELIERGDYGRIQLHTTALRLIAENDYDKYREFCQQAEHERMALTSWDMVSNEEIDV